MFIEKNISWLFLYGSSVSWVLKTLFCKYCISPQDEDPYGAVTNVFGHLSLFHHRIHILEYVLCNPVE